MTISNRGNDSPSSTCPPLPYSDSPEPISGGLTLQHIFLITAGVCVFLTAIISRFLVFKHLHRYTFPNEQRQIVRIVVTPIWFSTAALFSIAWYSAALYVQTVGYIYEAFALAAIFLLFVQYVAPDPHLRDAFFYNLPKLDRKGNETGQNSLAWFKVCMDIRSQFNWSIFYEWQCWISEQRIWVIVFLYPLLTIILYIVQWITLANGKYCPNSNKPHFAHFWVSLVLEAFLDCLSSLRALANSTPQVTLFTNVITSIAVFAVIGFYNRLKKPMASHKPLWKLVSFKLIVFLNFIQSLVFSYVSANKSVIAHMGHKFTFNDLYIGIPNLLICFEMVLLSLMMHFTYRSREYHPNNGRPRLSMWSAFLDSFNLSDIIVATARIPAIMSGGSVNARTQSFEGYERHKMGSEGERLSDFVAPPGAVPKSESPTAH